jgi:hypothetical protein
VLPGQPVKRLLQRLPLSPELNAAQVKFAAPNFHAHMLAESCQKEWSMKDAAEHLDDMVAAGKPTEQLWSYVWTAPSAVSSTCVCTT